MCSVARLSHLRRQTKWQVGLEGRPLFMTVQAILMMHQKGRTIGEERVQGVRRGQYLPARSDTEQKQDVHSRQGRVHAAGSRGALRHTNTSFCPGQCLLPPSWIFRSKHRHTEIEIACAHSLVQDWIKSPPFRVAPIDRLLCTCPRPLSHHFKRRRRYPTGATVSQPSLFGIWDSPLNPTDSGHFHETAQAPQ